VARRGRWQRYFSGLGIVAAFGVALYWALQGQGGAAAVWALFGALLWLPSARHQIAFGARKWATALLLLALAAVFAWGAILRYRERSFADAAVDAYLAVVFAGIALWAAVRWSPMPSVPAQAPRLTRIALGTAIVAGLFLLLGIAVMAAGSAPFAVLVWGMCIVCTAIAVGALVIQARFNSELEIARRLGFEDLYVYVEARRSQGFTMEQMAGETGLKPDALRHAGKTWGNLRRARADSP